MKVKFLYEYIISSADGHQLGKYNLLKNTHDGLLHLSIVIKKVRDLLRLFKERILVRNCR